MPETKTITIYKFNELSDKAKQRARDWYRNGDTFDAECVTFDAAQCADIIGIKIDTRAQSNPNAIYEPEVLWSGFWSQGDGACFEGSYRYKKGALAAIMSHAPKDEELHRIARELQEIQRGHFYRIRAIMTHSGHYYHSGCMNVQVFDRDDENRDIGDAEERIRQLMRDFADWIYSNLRKEYDWKNEDAQVDETILMNEYTFLEDGARE